MLDRGRLAIPSEDFYETDPARLVELFQLADLYGLEIHPLALRAAARDAKLLDRLRRAPRANAFFLDVLTSPRDPQTQLRWIHEAGGFGRLVPDFGARLAELPSHAHSHYRITKHTSTHLGPPQP